MTPVQVGALPRWTWSVIVERLKNNTSPITITSIWSTRSKPTRPSIRRPCADGDQDHVVEQHRRGGDEADELVEGVAREDGRARALGVHLRPLEVGHRRQGEEEPGDQVDARREARRGA